jgi:hypothetical protein
MLMSKSKLGCTFLLLLTSATAHAKNKDLFSNHTLLLTHISPSGLTEQQAKDILVMVLKHEKMYMYKEGFDIERINYAKGYTTFQVTYDTPKAAATEVIGAFAVSPRTGAVLEVNLCRNYSFHALTEIQNDIMKQTGATFASEKELLNQLGCGD